MLRKDFVKHLREKKKRFSDAIIKRKWTKTRDGVIEKETVWNDNSKIVKNKRIKWLIRELIVNGKE